MTIRAERATVLAVDDRRDSRRQYERRLGDEFEVLTAENGATALDMLDETVDVVLIHRTLPDTTSDEVLFSIRAAGYDCRVAMVTDEEPATDAIETGFDATLVKPVTADDLTETVERLLARSSYETQLDELYSLCVKRAKARADGGVNGVDSGVDNGVDNGGGTRRPDDDGGDGERSDAETSDVAEIEARIREIRESVDETVSSFETTDYRASFRDLTENG